MVTATAGPAIASLTGDYFPSAERARMLGLILTGELVGAGIGLVVSGDLGSALSWRYGFGWLSIPGVVLALAIWRGLVEPDTSGPRTAPRDEEPARVSSRASASSPGAVGFARTAS